MDWGQDESIAVLQGDEAVVQGVLRLQHFGALFAMEQFTDTCSTCRSAVLFLRLSESSGSLIKVAGTATYHLPILNFTQNYTCLHALA